MAAGLGVLFGVLCECLLLALVPILVEPPLDLIAQMLGPDRCQRAQTARSLDVSDKTNDDHRRGFDDRNGFNDFLLVQFGTRLEACQRDKSLEILTLHTYSVEISHNGGHAGLVAHCCRQMHRFLGVILWETLDFSSVPA